MRQEEIVLQQREKEIKTNKDFTYTVDVTKTSLHRFKRDWTTHLATQHVTPTARLPMTQ